MTRKHRIKKCQFCNREMQALTGCVTCHQEEILKAKVKKVMHEFKEGDLHSHTKTGPVVKKRQQAIAIALHVGRKAAKIKPKKQK